MVAPVGFEHSDTEEEQQRDLTSEVEPANVEDA